MERNYTVKEGIEAAIIHMNSWIRKNIPSQRGLEKETFMNFLKKYIKDCGYFKSKSYFLKNVLRLDNLILEFDERKVIKVGFLFKNHLSYEAEFRTINAAAEDINYFAMYELSKTFEVPPRHDAATVISSNHLNHVQTIGCQLDSIISDIKIPNLK